jgi:peptidoglycan/xylan/chitin deacetylase (PgdA/CDA1 family)
MYHSLDSSGSVVSVAPGTFADQMRWLEDSGFRGVSLMEAVAHRESQGQWPEYSVVLTFDDGFRNFYEAAFPILERCGFTATAFIVSGHIGGRNNWAPVPKGLGIRPMLTWQQVVKLSEHGIEIGAHTRTHPDLRFIPRSKVEDEIVTSRLEIEDRIQKPVTSFAYPFGRASKTAIGIAREAFQAACTTSLGRANGEALHQLSRVDMYYIRTLDGLKRLMSGRLDSYLAARRWMRLVRDKLISSSNGGPRDSDQD